MISYEIRSETKSIFFLYAFFLISTDIAILLDIPFLRQTFGFLFLTFFPGLLILESLKIDKIGSMLKFLFAAGLSISLLMLLGFFINAVFPIIGIIRPITVMHVMIVLNITLLILYMLCLKVSEKSSITVFLNIDYRELSSALFLCLIPFLAIFGSYIMNLFGNNILLLIMISTVGLVAILIGFGIFIPIKLYPLAVFVIAISLLYHQSLISTYLSGYDIHFEYYWSNLTKINGLWDPSISNNLNAMLSLTILAPIYSLILNTEITLIFKIVYPFIYSLVPLGLYHIFRKQTDEKLAFFACFFFMSLASFFAEMPTMARQEIAELFLILFVIILIDESIEDVRRSLLAIIFSLSIAVSHYGLSYIFMISIIPVWIILALNANTELRKSIRDEGKTISAISIILFIAFALSWYMYVSGSSSFETVINIADQIASSTYSDFLDPESAEGLKLMITSPKPGLLHGINGVFNYLNQIFILIGMIFVLKSHSMGFKKDYIAFSAICLFILFASISVPFFSGALNMTRLYHMTLIFLAPFCVIGGETVLKLKYLSNRIAGSSALILSVYLVIFLSYQSGLIFEVVEGKSSSISLDAANNVYSSNEREVASAKWLYSTKGNCSTYAEELKWLLLYSYYGPKGIFTFTDYDFNKIRTCSYIYIGTMNILESNITIMKRSEVRTTIEYINSKSMTDNRDKIYNNAGSEIYK